MGRPKALLPFAGSTFLETVLGRLEGAGIPPLVVTSPELALESCGRRVVVNPHPELGQLSSLRVGLLAGGTEAPWVLVALVDHPAVAPATYRALRQAAEAGGAHLWAPSYRGRRGHPVVFARECFEDLLEGPIDAGARWAVARHRRWRLEVPVEDPGIHTDVDTPQDYAGLSRRPPGSDNAR